MLYYIFNGRLYELVDAQDGQALIRNVQTEQEAWVDHRLLKGCRKVVTNEYAVGNTRTTP